MEERLKPKSFRIDDETAEKIKEITAEIGGNQQETLAKMIEAYEFQRGKAVLTGRKDDIDKFEKFITMLTRMYMSVLEENQNITETVRMEFEALLRSKDVTIQDLQEKKDLLQKEKEEAVLAKNVLKDDNNSLSKRIETETSSNQEKFIQFMAMLKDKDELNKALTDSCLEQKKQIENHVQSIEGVKHTEQKLAEAIKISASLEQKNSDLELHIKQLDTMIEEIKEKSVQSIEHAVEIKELEFQKRLFETEKKHQREVSALEQEKRVEIDTYQNKYLSLLQELEKNSSGQKSIEK